MPSRDAPLEGGGGWSSVSSAWVAGRFLRGRLVFLAEAPKAARRSLARSRYSSVVVSWEGVELRPAFDILAWAFETRSSL